MKHFHNKISILIPTKDRKTYLRKTLKTCFMQKYPNSEIIVCDDGSSDGTVEMLKELQKSHKNLRVLVSQNNQGMMKNFERGLDTISSGYVIFLGGDDGLMPNSLFEINNYINHYKAEAITWPTNTYFYPNTNTKNGQLVINNNTFKKQQKPSWIKGLTYLKNEQEKLFYVNDEKCPMIYVKGIVSIKVIQEIKKKSPNNNFYQCSTPDGYSGFIIAGHVKEYLYVKHPLTIHGVSKTSQGLNYVKGDDESKKLSEEFFSKHKNIKLHRKLGEIGYSPLITLMSADFIYTANEINCHETEINPKIIIDKSLGELQRGNFHISNIRRELELIHEYASKMNLEEYFFYQLKKRKRDSKYNLQGNAFSPKQLYLDAKQFNVEDVYEASVFAQGINIKSILTPKLLFEIFISSIMYKLSEFKKRKRLYDFYVYNN